MAFTSSPGCSMCGIVSRAIHGSQYSPRPLRLDQQPLAPEILWKDDNFTVFREKAHPVSSNGHIIIAFNLHVPNIYALSSTDLPLLAGLRDLATRRLHALTPTGSHTGANYLQKTSTNSPFRIGFITPPFKDHKIPVTDHLHAHAYIGPADLMGWWRGMAYSPLSWYDINDLIAEIRESVSNNRVKSGYINRGDAPIDMVPSAGARSGTASGVETSVPGLGQLDAELECGDSSVHFAYPHSQL